MFFDLAKTNSVTVVQRHFRTKYGKQSIYNWYERFENSGCVFTGKESTGRPPVTEEQNDNVCDVFV